MPAHDERGDSAPNSVDQDRIRTLVAELLSSIGEDPADPRLVDTPSRVAEAYQEFFSGVGVDAASVLNETYPRPHGAGDADPVLMRGIEFRSICEHHLLPFFGIAHLAYLPSDRLVGLGRLARTVEVVAARPQLQERLTDQIADALVEGLAPGGVLVVLEAEHRCVAARGPNQRDSTTVTVASRGALSEPAARAEILRLIGITRD